MWGLMKLLYIVSSADLGRIFWSLRRSPIVLFTLFIIILKWSSKDKRLSRTTPKCFCELVSDTLLLLKARGGWYSFFAFLLNITSWACLLGSGLKIHDSHLTCKVENKFLNVREWVEVAEWNKRWPLPSLAIQWIVSVCERKLW